MTAAPVPGENRALPPAARRWNWGAVWLNVIWGVRHNTDFAFLTFIPVLGLIVPIILGLKGGEWAWKNNHWESVEQFEKTQKDWSFYGWVFFFVLAVSIFIPAKNWLVSRTWEQSPVCTQAVARLLKIDEIHNLVGENSQWRVRLGGVKHYSRKRAHVGIRLRGTQGTAQALFYIMKLDGHWSVYRITLFYRTGDAGIDYPLPKDMLLQDAGEEEDDQAGTTKTYRLILQTVAIDQKNNMIKIIARLNQITPEEAAKLVHLAPQPVYRGATRAGALKLIRKFADFETILTMEEESPQP